MEDNQWLLARMLRGEKAQIEYFAGDVRKTNEVAYCTAVHHVI